MKSLTTNRFGLLWAVAVLLGGCGNGDEASISKKVLIETQRLWESPDDSKVDYLIVLDNSFSMCSRRVPLADMFMTYFDTLQSDIPGAGLTGADYRLAVVSVDMSAENPRRGRFIDVPNISPQDPGDCVLTGQVEDYWAEVCASTDWSSDSPIMSNPSPGFRFDDENRRRLQCLILGLTPGDGFEMGLEAMRHSLSCNGPNANHFAPCCVDDPTTGLQRYDPNCLTDATAGVEPDFLRPDAKLVVIFVSDENDCSEPAANQPLSKRVICKYTLVDQNGDSIPDGFEDRTLCDGKSPADCYHDECGAMNPGECFSERCAVSREVLSACDWERQKLTPVEDYFEFLSSLKARPTEQLVVVPLVGPQPRTESGHVISFDQPSPENRRDDDCAPVYEPNNPTSVTNLSTVLSDRCCPQGRCVGEPVPLCDSGGNPSETAQSLAAFAGTRYIELSEMFGGAPEDNLCTVPAADSYRFLEPLMESVSTRRVCLKHRLLCVPGGATTVAEATPFCPGWDGQGPLPANCPPSGFASPAPSVPQATPTPGSRRSEEMVSTLDRTQNHSRLSGVDGNDLPDCTVSERADPANYYVSVVEAQVRGFSGTPDPEARSGWQVTENIEFTNEAIEKSSADFHLKGHQGLFEYGLPFVSIPVEVEPGGEECPSGTQIKLLPTNDGFVSRSNSGSTNVRIIRYLAEVDSVR